MALVQNYRDQELTNTIPRLIKVPGNNIALTGDGNTFEVRGAATYPTEIHIYADPQGQLVGQAVTFTVEAGGTGHTLSTVSVNHAKVVGDIAGSDTFKVKASRTYQGVTYDAYYTINKIASTAATVYEAETSVGILNYYPNTNTWSPTAATGITVTGKSSTGGAPLTGYSGRYSVYTSINGGSSWTARYTATVDAASYTYDLTGVTSATTHIRFRLHQAGQTIDDVNGTTLLDTTTVPVLISGYTGSGGSTGYVGSSTKGVSLTTGSVSPVVIYDQAGDLVGGAGSITVTATQFGCTGTPYYKFYLEGAMSQDWGVSNTYSYSKRSLYTDMPDVVKVELGDGGTSPVVATDQIAFIPSKIGEGGVTAVLSNDSHTLPVSATGTITYTNSGTNFYVYQGGTALTFNTEVNSAIYPGSNGQYNVDVTQSGITPGAVSGGSTTTGVIADHTNATTDQSTVTLTFYIKKLDGTQTSVVKTQTLAKSRSGYTGSGGGTGYTGSGGTGYTGSKGVSFRIAYALFASSNAWNTIIWDSEVSQKKEDTGDVTLPGTTGGTALTTPDSASAWTTTIQVPASGQAQFETHGYFDPSTNKTYWNRPILSNLRVSDLSALTAYIGSITSGTIVSGDLISGTVTSAVIKTATSGKRIEMNVGSNNEIKGYRAGGTLSYTVDADTPILRMDSPDQTGTSGIIRAEGGGAGTVLTCGLNNTNPAAAAAAVYGWTNNAGTGVLGETLYGAAVKGQTSGNSGPSNYTGGTGVLGISALGSSGSGVLGSASGIYSAGVRGKNYGTNCYGVVGVNSNGAGVVGSTATGYGVYGEATGNGNGGYFIGKGSTPALVANNTSTGYALEAVSTSGSGITATANTAGALAITASSTSGGAIYASVANSTYASIQGVCSTSGGYGILGMQQGAGIGVIGSSTSGYGVQGKVATGQGVRGEATTTGVGVYAYSGSGDAINAVIVTAGKSALYATAGAGYGAYLQASTGTPGMFETTGSGSTAATVRISNAGTGPSLQLEGTTRTFFPASDNTGTIGNATYTWNSIYATDITVVNLTDIFTGGHYALVTKDFAGSIGDIVTDTDEYLIKKDIYNAVISARVSVIAQQKGVVGVYSRMKKLYKDMPEIPVIFKGTDGNIISEFDEIAEVYDAISMNSLGEGLINVCGENGNIEIGDLIVTSSIPGKGMKQSDDIVRNITVAKSRENVTFESPTEVKQIACIYLCG